MADAKNDTMKPVSDANVSERDGGECDADCYPSRTRVRIDALDQCRPTHTTSLHTHTHVCIC